MIWDPILGIQSWIPCLVSRIQWNEPSLIEQESKDFQAKNTIRTEKTEFQHHKATLRNQN